MGACVVAVAASTRSPRCDQSTLESEMKRLVLWRGWGGSFALVYEVVRFSLGVNGTRPLMPILLESAIWNRIRERQFGAEYHLAAQPPSQSSTPGS